MHLLLSHSGNTLNSGLALLKAKVQTTKKNVKHKREINKLKVFCLFLLNNKYIMWP